MNVFMKCFELIESPHDLPCDSHIPLIDAFPETMGSHGLPGPATRPVPPTSSPPHPSPGADTHLHDLHCAEELANHALMLGSVVAQGRAWEHDSPHDLPH